MKNEEIIKKLGVVPNEADYEYLNKESELIILHLKEALIKKKLEAGVFIGGSFAKRTLVKKDKYDIDLFVRFDWKYENLTELLEEAIKLIAKKLNLEYKKIHGSRDYFRIVKNNILFEIIPVTKIKNPREARNVTDLSYFHVNYIKKNINQKIINEIALFKSFCKANGYYGAESYIQGFSGYAIECLVIYYKTFDKILRALTNSKERLILDPGNNFKDKNEILINMNSSKLNSPIILIDPTWKDRNVLAALSTETFNRFKKTAIEFIKKPSIEFFNDKKLDIVKLKNEAKKSNSNFLDIIISTNKQEGDIAGTKLKKFNNFLIIELERYYKVKFREFIYDNKQKADIYLVLKSKGSIVKIGPPVTMIKERKAFEKSNKNTFIKNGFVHSNININFSAKKYLLSWIKKYSKKIKEMDIISIKVK